MRRRVASFEISTAHSASQRAATSGPLHPAVELHKSLSSVSIWVLLLLSTAAFLQAQSDSIRLVGGGNSLIGSGLGVNEFSNGFGDSLDVSEASESSTASLPDDTFDDDQRLLSEPFDYHASMPVITKRELANAIKQAQSLVETQLRVEDSPEGVAAAAAPPLGGVSGLLRGPSPADWQVYNETRQALISEEASRILARQFKLNRKQILRGLPLISLEQSELGKGCARASRSFSCVPGRYRSLSGHCNNVKQPDWGAARSPLARWAPARYSDHLGRPAGRGLPAARLLAGALWGVGGSGEPAARNETSPEGAGRLSALLSFLAQFVLQDVAHVAPLGPTPSCCSRPPAGRHAHCLPLEPLGAGPCLEYARSAPAPRPGCSLGPRDQLNLASSYLDGSPLYGSSEAQLAPLRARVGGRLRSVRTSGSRTQPAQELPPLLTLEEPPPPPPPDDEERPWRLLARQCRSVSRRQASPQPEVTESGATSRCFRSGDPRTNGNLGILMVHTIFLREHNRIADELAQLNAHWTDERIFEEARRILVAQIQHLTYSELLPTLLGDDMMQRFNLSLKSQGFETRYEPALSAATGNELASAVFPALLASLPSQLERFSERLELLGSSRLLNPEAPADGSELFARNRFAQYLTGLVASSASDLASGGDQPSSTSGSGVGEQLAALAIQQARDHGLASYLYWRRACGLRPELRTWRDFRLVMAERHVATLEQMYGSPQQVELYMARLERPMAGAALGPTLACLAARQFHLLKFADRYWYENDLPGSGFSSAQLEALRRTSLAGLLCRASQGGLAFVQPAPLLASDPYLNAYQYCSNGAMGALELDAWRQPITSAQQLATSLESSPGLGPGSNTLRSLADGSLIEASFARAKRQVEDLHIMDSRQRAARQTGSARAGSHPAGSHAAASWRQPTARLRRQALKLANQSLLFELATNGVVRSMLHHGKDREQMQSIQSDVRDFVASLESIQLENLIDNLGSSGELSELIQRANSQFLSEDQRRRLLQAGDPVVATSASGLPLEQLESATSGAASERTSSVSANCQDEDITFPCDHTTPFRTITGWCNNLERPHFGQSFTQHDRLLASQYDDGLSKARQSSSLVLTSGERLALPSARLVSIRMHDSESRLHPRYSLALMQFGQFGVDHDLTRTPFSVAADGSLLDCSACDSRLTVHRDCLPIELPAEDLHFNGPAARAAATGSGSGSGSGGAAPAARRCLHFVRSLNGQLGLGPRQQVNALTSYMDGSEIYGSDNCEAKSLRAFSGGRLNATYYPTGSSSDRKQLREVLPVTRANPECVTPNGFCFHAGDQRASEQPGLTAIHTVFMRLHNSIVGQLAELNKHWNDERLYQEGRRIVGAILQRITFGEFAPRLLGLDYMSKFNLLLSQVGYSNHYQQCSASILNEFASAAFRMGHSLIRSAFPLLNKNYQTMGKSFQLRKAFFNSQRIFTETNLIDAILRGVVSTPIETLDNSVTDELTNHLFEKPKQPFSGMDLIALNIQRARDHGIQPYNKYRVKCNLTRAKTFDDLAGEIPQRLIKRLSKLYASVDDIDLFSGGLSELPVHGGLIGPTLGCIIGLQFWRLKHCDRFWHETDDPYVRFTAPQLAEIRKMTLAKVICQESDTIDTIQRNAMDVSDQFLNPRVACSSLPSLDPSPWRENLKSCLVNNKIKIDLGQSKRINPCKSCTCTSEGPVCRTAKIDCLKVMKKASNLSNIMADKSCLVQCAWALDMQP